MPGEYGYMLIPGGDCDYHPEEGKSSECAAFPVFLCVSGEKSSNVSILKIACNLMSHNTWTHPI